MALITLKGNPCNTNGNFVAVGAKASDFSLTNTSLEKVTLKSFPNMKLVLNIFPSIDTPVCATSVKKFNEAAAKLEGVKVLCVSQDLPFALKRFCGAEGIEGVVPVSAFRDPAFGKNLGVHIVDGPLEGLFARAVVVLDESGTVQYAELVKEIAEEPNYEKALSALK